MTEAQQPIPSTAKEIVQLIQSAMYSKGRVMGCAAHDISLRCQSGVTSLWVDF